MIEKTLFNYKPSEIAKYIRLSLADDLSSNKNESESVINQRKIINEYISKSGIDSCFCKEFIDDGVSGTSFDRPAWNRLQDEMDAGIIKVVITKNLSRLGRSNFECNYFLDYYFPEKKVRYIAIQEQVDTFFTDNSNNEYAALNNFINEKYSRDLSKNIRRIYKVKQNAGEYMGSIPLFGYVKDPNNKHRLLIDEEAARVVKLIFNLYLKTKSQSYVTRYLTENKFLIPEVYKNTRRGLKVKNPYLWNCRTVRNILRNQMYIGNMVQNVHRKKSFRDKKIEKVHPKDWIIVEKTHKAIVDKKKFDKVQILLNANYRRPIKNDYLLKGLLFCYECGSSIGVSKIKNIYYTYCNNYKKHSINNVCTSHVLDYNKLEIQILNVVNSTIEKYKKEFQIHDIVSKKIIEYKNIFTNFENKIEKINIDIKQIELFLEKAYDDKLKSIIDCEMYESISRKYINQKEQKLEEIKNIKNIICLRNKFFDVFLEEKNIVDKYECFFSSNLKELMLRLIDKVCIHSNKDVDLYFKFKEA